MYMYSLNHLNYEKSVFSCVTFETPKIIEHSAN